MQAGHRPGKKAATPLSNLGCWGGFCFESLIGPREVLQKNRLFQSMLKLTKALIG